MQTNKMPYFILAVVVLLGAGASLSFATPSAESFVKTAVVANMFEIDSSKLALEQSKNDGVRTFAQQMVDDHGKVGDAMKDTLPKTKVDPASVPTDLDKKHMDLMDKLKNDKPENFDKDYIKMQLDAHKDAVSLFGKYAKGGDEPALKQFAADNLPTLKSHLQHVTELKKNYKK